MPMTATPTSSPPSSHVPGPDLASDLSATQPLAYSRALRVLGDHLHARRARGALRELLALLAAVVVHDRLGKATRLVLFALEARAEDTLDTVLCHLEDHRVPAKANHAILDHLARLRVPVAGERLEALILRCTDSAAGTARVEDDGAGTAIAVAPPAAAGGWDLECGVRAIRALAVTDPAPAAALGRLARAEHLPLRLSVEAVDALGLLRDQASFEQLVGLFQSEGTGRLRSTVASALGRLGTDEAIEILGVAARFGSGDRRMHAVRALTGCRGERAVALLSECAASPLAAVRREAVLALARRGASPERLEDLRERECSQANRLLLEELRARARDS